MAGCNRGIGHIEVKAPNGQPSLLFDDLVSMNDGNLDAAYKAYLKSETMQVQTDLAGTPRDANGELRADVMMDYLNPVKKSKPLSPFLTDTLKEEEQYILEPGLKENGEQENFYRMVDKEGKPVKDLTRTSSKIQEFVYGTAAFKDKKDKDTTTIVAEIRANDLFKEAGTGAKIKLDGVEYTYAEYVEAEKKSLLAGATRGTLVHLKIQESLARSAGNKQLADSLLGRIQETEAVEGIPANKYDWVTSDQLGVWDNIVEATGIRDIGEHQTKVYSELRVGDEDLGMASTIDLAVEDPLTGKIRIADFKTGKRFLESRNSNTMVFGRELTPIYNTAKDRARLQVVLNAVAIKAKHPEAQFEIPLIIWLPDQEVGSSGKNIFDVDVRDYLRMIEKHYQVEHPEAYAKLIAKSPNLFNPNHYGAAVNTSFAQDLIDDKTGMRSEEKLIQLQLELERLELAIRLRPDGSKLGKGQASPDEQRRRGELVMKIQQAQASFALPVNINSAHEMEIGLLVKWFGVLSDTNNPYLQAYSQSLARASQQYNAERARIDFEFNILLQKAVDKVYGNITGAEKAFTSKDKSKLWDQLIDKKIIEDEDGTKRMNVGMKTEQSEGYHQLPKELQDLSVFMRTNMKDVFNHVMVDGPNAVVVDNSAGLKKTKLDIYNEKNTFTYSEAFIPKMGITSEEIYKRFKQDGLLGKGGKDLWKYWKTKHLTEFFETNIEGDNQQDYGIPVKYVGSTATITAIDTHSLDLERSFRKYMEAMLTKKHYDNVYAVGMAMSGYLQHSNGGTSKTADFLEHAVYRNILKQGSRGEDKLWTNGAVIGRFDGKDVHLSTRKLLRGLGRGVASAGLWLNIPSMAGNAIQAEWAVAKESILYSLNDDINTKDLTFKNFNKAKLEVAKMQADFVQGKGKSNPIHVLMAELDLYPQIQEESYNRITGGKKAFSLDHLTFLYQHAEDMTTANVMVTALMTMKVKSGKYKGKSMWEMYKNSLVVDPKTGYGKFELPSDFKRGKLQLGDGSLEEISGLHAFEIQRLKSMTRKLKGGYRREERSMIEASYLGETFMLFRRWLPATILGTWKGKHLDISVGSFELLEQREGEDIYQWKARVVEGKLRTTFNVFAAALNWNQTHKWADLSYEQKKGVIDVGISVATWITIASLIAQFWGDDDDKEDRKRLMAITNRLAEHVNPITAREIIEVPAAAKSISNLMNGLWALTMGSASYAASGDEDDLYTQKGDLRGAKQIMRNLPFGAAAAGVENYLED